MFRHRFTVSGSCTDDQLEADRGSRTVRRFIIHCNGLDSQGDRQFLLLFYEKGNMSLFLYKRPGSLLSVSLF